jgi:hypothetical protein
VVKAEPPDPFRGYLDVNEMSDGLVERCRLADTSRPENELEAMRLIKVEGLPELSRQRAFDPTCERGRHGACPVPWVLLVEHALQIFRLRSPGSQRRLLL